MEDILAMVEGASTSEITTFNQIDQTIFKKLLTKSSVWDIYEIPREEYMKKSDSEKKSLIIKFYYYMLEDKILLFVFFIIVWILYFRYQISLCSVDFLINDEVFSS